MERVNRRHRKESRRHHARRSELHEAAALGKLVRVQSLVLAGAELRERRRGAVIIKKGQRQVRRGRGEGGHGSGCAKSGG